jgi:hypothetical protein
MYGQKVLTGIGYLTRLSVVCKVIEVQSRIVKHFSGTAEKIALGKVIYSNGILKQPAFPLTTVFYCCQETYGTEHSLTLISLVWKEADLQECRIILLNSSEK